MAYTAGNTILDDEYNAFAASVNTLMSTGAGDSGYGQTAISTVAPGTTVSATQWATLLNKISSAASHQGNAITAITNPVTTDTITAEAALAANIVDVTAARFDAAASGTAITAGGVSSSTATWTTTVNTTQRVTFGSAEQMRFFFNAGGRITVAFSRSGGAAAAKNTGWTDLCAACGTLSMTGASASKTIAGVAYTGTTKIGGSGAVATLSTTLGENSLTGAYQPMFKQYDVSANYTANYISVDALNGSAFVELRTIFQDDAADSGVEDNIDGTLSVTITVVPPSTANISSSWGTPVISTTEAL